MSFQVDNNAINIVHESKLYKDTYVPNKTRSKYESALDIFLKNKHLYEYTSFTRYVSTIQNYDTSDPLGIYQN
jgi:hypothetical protein